MDTEENTLKAGDVCLDCQQQGFEKRLRYFKLNLNGDTLLKCESNECMYPYNDEISSSDEEQEEVHTLTDINSFKFIDDFMEQFSHETETQNTNNDLQINANNTEQVIQFDINFLDNFDEIDGENIKKSEITTKNIEFIDNKSNNIKIENKLLSLPVLNSTEYEMPSSDNFKKIDDEILIKNVEILDNKSNVKVIENEVLSQSTLNSSKSEISTAISEDCENKQNDNPTFSFITEVYDSVKDCKPKVDIQSIETIKIELPAYNFLPACSKTIKLSSLECNTKSLHVSPTTCQSPSSVSNVASTSSINLDTCLQKSASTETTTASSPKSSTSFDIPKAIVFNRSDFLQKLEKINKKTLNLNPKLKKIKKPKNNMSSNDTFAKSSFSLSNEPDYSVDKISKILTANKIKRNK